ncbi:hypothetical protein CQ018_08800 [Arthrobacter sp. MYb227]|nr:hypothetical protein CQ018_08800 [Arthrobacter sp. MYb227]
MPGLFTLDVIAIKEAIFGILSVAMQVGAIHFWAFSSNVRRFPETTVWASGGLETPRFGSHSYSLQYLILLASRAWRMFGCSRSLIHGFMSAGKDILRWRRIRLSAAES